MLDCPSSKMDLTKVRQLLASIQFRIVENAFYCC